MLRKQAAKAKGMDIIDFKAPPINIEKTDHIPIFGKFRICIDTRRRKQAIIHKIKYNLLTEDTAVRHAYKNRLGVGLHKIEQNCKTADVELATSSVLHHIRESLQDTCGSRKIRNSGRKFRIDDEFKKLFRKKQNAYRRFAYTGIKKH